MVAAQNQLCLGEAGTISDATREIAEVRRTGIAFDEGEFNLEVRCIAVPARDFTGRIVGAIGISGPIWRQTQQALQMKAKIVQAAGTRLSEAFGAKEAAESR